VAQDGINGHDPRTLGSARFTKARIRRFEQMEDWSDRVRADKEDALRQVISEVRSHYGLSKSILLSRSKRQQVSHARALICYLGCFVIGLPYGCVGEEMGISASGAYMAARRGKKLAIEHPEMVEELELPIV
jgi:chromosomal replication initiation ATPase DnaA